MIQCGLHAIVSSVHTFIPSLALVTVTSAHTHANPYRKAKRDAATSVQRVDTA